MALQENARWIKSRAYFDIADLYYQAAFDRPLEEAGLDYWIDTQQAGLGYSYIAEALVNSAEFGALHAGQDRAEIISSFYQNVLGRTADTDGLKFWTDSDLTPAQLLDSIARSQESLVKNAAALHGFEDAVVNGTLIANAGELFDYTTAPTVVEVPVPLDVPVIVDKPDILATTHGPFHVDFVNAGGNLYLGDGTTPAQGFSTVDDPTSKFLFGVEITPRQTATSVGGYIPVGSTFDGTTLHVTDNVPAGPQAIENGSFQNVANRGAVNSNVVIGLHPDSDFDFREALDAGYQIKLGLDTDKTAADSLLNLTAVYNAANDTLDFVVRGTNRGFVDFKGNGNASGEVASESIQQNFVTSGGVAALTQAAQFDNHLTLIDPNGHVVQELHWALFMGQPGLSPAEQLA
ncbi:DUF4214 domain-containing protein [Methylobacterium durans]|uniref:DUF4214 domain-containing protein n=1 Tax=Methylobacterium durans TaxID=2202825 RepID=UPI0013A5B292|nr:DUF4214 domain-containing protein [Methylobacterium durans]